MSQQNGHKNETIFTPQEVSALTVKEIKRRRDAPREGLRTGIDKLDDHLLPLRTGELIPVLGFTSNYKSGLMTCIARNATAQIEHEENTIIVYCTWEQSVEEQGMLELAHATHIDATMLAKGDLTESEWKRMMGAAMKRAVTPLWHVGHSSQSGKRRPRLSMSDVALALAFAVDEMGHKPALICLDYLQRIRSEDNRSRREQVMEMVDRAKDMALAFSCPVMLGTQAGRQVLDRAWKLPQMHDSQETSNIEQSADKFLSLWMPKNTEVPGEMIQDKYPVTDNLLLLGLLKQKFGPAPKILALHVEPAVNEIYSMEKVNIGSPVSTERAG